MTNFPSLLLLIISSIILTLQLQSFLFVDAISSCGDFSAQTGDVVLDANIATCTTGTITIRDSTLTSITIEAQSNIPRIIIKNIVCQQPPSTGGGKICVHFSGAVTNIEEILIENIVHTFGSPSASIIGTSGANVKIKTIFFPSSITGNAVTDSSNRLQIDDVRFGGSIEINVDANGGNIEVFVISFEDNVSNMNLISFSNIVSEDFSLTADGGEIDFRQVRLAEDGVLQGSTSSAIHNNATLTVTNLTMKNFVVSSKNACEIRCLHFVGDSQVLSFSHVILDNFLQDSFSAPDAKGSVTVFIFYFHTDSIVSGTSTSNSSFSVSNQFQRNFTVRSDGTSNIRGAVVLSGTLDGFAHYSFKNVIQEDLQIELK